MLRSSLHMQSFAIEGMTPKMGNLKKPKRNYNQKDGHLKADSSCLLLTLFYKPVKEASGISEPNPNCLRTVSRIFKFAGWLACEQVLH